MQDKRVYTIGSAKLDMAYFEGFVHRGSDMLSVMNSNNGVHFIILNRFCSYEKGTRWGRFHCKANLSQNSTLKIRALASDGEAGKAQELNDFFHDPLITWGEKKACFDCEGIQFINHEDVLLYELAGEYLWIAIEIEGDNDDRIYDMKLDSRGDNFMQTFPEIYQDEGSFFHRYLSIFSSIYQDMSDEMENIDKYLDIETTPVPVLIEIAGWLGFETEGDFLSEDMLRRLIKKIYQLNRIKGTKEVIRRLIDVLLGEEAVIIERNRFEVSIPGDFKDIYQKLFGNSMQDVTILVWRPADEKLQSQVMYLLKQFKPARSHIRLVFTEKCANLDSYCFLDCNAVLSQMANAYADGNSKMNSTAVLC